MKRTSALAVAALLATGCSNPFAADPDPTLELSVYGGERLVQWRHGDTTRVLAKLGFDDPEGFAGLEVVISGDNMRRRTYTASYFASAGETKFGVPDTGYATVTARIVQDGHIVAEVSKRWGLASKIQWSIDIERGPWPAGNGIPKDLENPECVWFWCHEVWRSPLAEDVANYADEALWVTLYRYHPDECADVC